MDVPLGILVGLLHHPAEGGAGRTVSSHAPRILVFVVRLLGLEGALARFAVGANAVSDSARPSRRDLVAAQNTNPGGGPAHRSCETSGYRSLFREPLRLAEAYTKS